LHVNRYFFVNHPTSAMHPFWDKLCTSFIDVLDRSP
jgi:hypothetical protein